MGSKIATVSLEITLWDEEKTEALIRSLAKDPRVMSVTQIDRRQSV